MPRLLVLSLRAFLSVAMIFALVPALPVAADSTTTFGFELPVPNVSENPSTGETIQVTGAGTFDPSAATVLASGSFTEFSSSGSVLAKGTWKATSFVSWTPFGGPNPGTQGGVLEIEVTLSPSGGPPVPNQLMTVTCIVNAPPGITSDSTLVGDFTQGISGFTRFHEN